jgi:hypothetical protein
LVQPAWAARILLAPYCRLETQPITCMTLKYGFDGSSIYQIDSCDDYIQYRECDAMGR